MKRIKKLIVLILCVIMISSLMSPIASAEESPYPINFDGVLHTIEDPRYPLSDIVVYCMNNELNWPHELNGNQPPNYVDGYLESTDIENYDEMIGILEKILFAGYPYNGKKLFQIVSDDELYVPSEDEFNNLLKPSPELVKSFPELGKYNYTLQNWQEHSSVLQNFSTYVIKMSSTDTIGGLTKSDIISMPFFKAYMCVSNFDNPQQAFAEWYSSSYYVTEKQAYDATQYAVWKVLNDYNVPNNNISDISDNELSQSLLNYATSDETILKELPENNILLTGDFSFTQGDDGKWYSGKLTISEPEGYNGLYELYLPDGMSVLNIEKTIIFDDYGYTTVYGNEEYVLVSDNPPEDTDEFYISHNKLWGSTLHQYSPEEDIEYNGKKYQRMLGSYVNDTYIDTTFTYQNVATGDLTVTKNVLGDDVDPDKDFTFTVTLSDTTINGTYGDTYSGMTFENGVATFVLGNGEYKTAENLPVGITYSVSETNNTGYTVESENATGVISGNKPASVIFTNTSSTSTSGSLLVEKKVSGNAADIEKNFTFTVTLSDTNINGTYGDMEFKDGISTFELKHNESKTATDIPIGIDYKVTESTNDNDYTAESQGEEGEINANQTSIASFTNTKNVNESPEPTTGILSVKKIVSGNAADTTKEFKFTVTLSDNTITGPYGDMEFLNGVATFNLTHNDSKTAIGLPKDIEYSVSEDDSYGYTVVSEKETGTIIADQWITATFTNTLNITTGNLSVQKILSGDSVDNTKDFTFNLTLSDTTINGTYGDITFNNGVATFTLKHNEVKTATNLPEGITYEVTESNIDGYTASYENQTGTIVANDTINVKCTNSIIPSPSVGDLSIQKIVSGTAEDTTKDFTFTLTLSDTTINGAYGDITFTNGVATFTLKHNEVKTATNLPKGITYEVTESNIDGYTASYENQTGTIVANDTINVKCTNSIIPSSSVGDLSIQKIVSGTAEDTTKDFTFTLTLSDTTINGAYGDITFTNGVATFTLKHDEFKIATGLPANINYTITESYDSDYAVTSSNATGSIIENNTVTASFTNTKVSTPLPDPSTGSLSIQKIVSGTAEDTSKDFTFTLTLSDTTINGTYGDMEFINGVATFTLKHDEFKIATGLPANIDYTITESYDSDYAVTSSNATGSIIENNTVTASFTNTKVSTPLPDPSTGSLSIQKIVSGTAEDTSKDFTFTLTLSDTTINGTYGDMEFINGVATFTLKHDEFKIATGLPANINYTITESFDSDYIVTSSNATGSIIENNTVTASFTNTKVSTPLPDPSTGSLSIQKIVSGTAEDTSKDFTFTLTLSDTTINGTYGDMEFINGVATFTLKHDEFKIATGLPANINYTITESYNSDYIVTSSNATGSIIKGEIVTASFKNTKVSTPLPDPSTGSLSIQKIVIGTADDITKDFTFTLTLSDTTINGTYGDMTFENGVATFTLKHKESKIATGLPANIKYTVNETTNSDYTVDSDKASGNIIEDELINVTFTNTRVSISSPDPSTGSLSIQKIVIGTADDITKEFAFTLTLSDTTINGTYGDMTFKNGVATFTLKHKESKIATGLPSYIKYTVAETTNSDYSVDSDKASGSIIQDELINVTFTNTRVSISSPDPSTGSLTVRKTVIGNDADTNKPFTFTVTLSDDTINGTYGDMTFKNGVATFTLKHNESKTATGLPFGITYKVTESDNEAYTFVALNSSGTINKNEIVVEFENTWSPNTDIPNTGDYSNIILWSSLILLSVIGLIVCIAIWNKRNKKIKKL